MLLNFQDESSESEEDITEAKSSEDETGSSCQDMQAAPVVEEE